MKGLVQLIVCTAVGLAVSGCMVGKEEGSEAKKRNVADYNPNAFSFANCERLLEKKYDRTPHNDNQHIIYRSYSFKENTCINLTVGLYEQLARVDMRAQHKAGGDHFQRSAGSFEAAVRFMDRTDITCEDSGKSFKLIFPLHPDSGYGEIRASCSGSSEQQQINIHVGLDTESGNKLAITIEDREEEPTTYHAFDTNRDGQLIKHIKVVGYGGREQLLLDR